MATGLFDISAKILFEIKIKETTLFYEMSTISVIYHNKILFILLRIYICIEKQYFVQKL